MLLRFTRAGGRPVYLESNRISTVSPAYRAGDDIEATYDGVTAITCGNESILVLGNADAVALWMLDVHEGRVGVQRWPGIPTFNHESKVDGSPRAPGHPATSTLVAAVGEVISKSVRAGITDLRAMWGDWQEVITAYDAAMSVAEDDG